MTPWETLGVKRTATAKQIREAFQRLTKVWHPDRIGGDEKKMSEINSAYDILSSPQKRLRWEKTGSTAPPPQIDLQVRDFITGKLLARLGEDENPLRAENIVEAVRLSIMKERNSLLQQQASGKDSVNRARKRLKRLKFKGKGPDLVTQMLEFELEKVEQTIGGTQDRIELLAKALEFIQLYEFAPEGVSVWIDEWVAINPQSGALQWKP